MSSQIMRVQVTRSMAPQDVIVRVRLPTDPRARLAALRELEGMADDWDWAGADIGAEVLDSRPVPGPADYDLSGEGEE